MRDPPWKRLGLDEDDWRECRVAAREMSLATGTRVSASVVAVEFAMARTFDEPTLQPQPPQQAAGARSHRTFARR